MTRIIDEEIHLILIINLILIIVGKTDLHPSNPIIRNLALNRQPSR
jgi:hypothetical protein